MGVWRLEYGRRKVQSTITLDRGGAEMDTGSVVQCPRFAPASLPLSRLFADYGSGIPRSRQISRWRGTAEVWLFVGLK